MHCCFPHEPRLRFHHPRYLEAPKGTFSELERTACSGSPLADTIEVQKVVNPMLSSGCGQDLIKITQTISAWHVQAASRHGLIVTPQGLHVSIDSA